MFGAARPGMGTGDNRRFRHGGRCFKGAKNFLRRLLHGKKCSSPGNLRKFKSWRMCDETPNLVLDHAGVRMSKLLRKPDAVLWVLSISQAVGMLAFNILLRATVS
jgi:hypothetical protein